ncbi:sugar ABC transporter permease [Spirochaetia bacterium]|nr:sugar ABC transporter permease [Spirochaetia bacterium]
MKIRRSVLQSMQSWLIFVGPAMILLAVFVIYPIIQVLILSFQKYNLVSGIPKRFIGLRNFRDMIVRPDFGNSLKVSGIFTAVGVTSTMILGVALALLLNSQGWIIRILRGISLIPFLICGVAVAFAWVLLYNPTFGLFNFILSVFNLGPIDWLGDQKMAIYSIAFIETWQFTPFVMILTLAGLQGISSDYYEAAAIDGANKVQRLLHITLPLLKNVLLTIFILRLIDCIKSFEKVRILTVGGPVNSTDIMSHYVYRISFIRNELGLGAAGALVVTLITAILTVIIVKTIKSDDVA